MEENIEIEQSESIEKFIARQVESGRYENRDALIKEAVRQLQKQESELKYLAEQIHEPWEQWQQREPGKAIELDSLFERVDQRIGTLENSVE